MSLQYSALQRFHSPGLTVFYKPLIYLYILTINLWIMTNYFSNQGFFLWNKEDNHTFLIEWHFLLQLHNTWLLIKKTLVLFQLFLNGAIYCLSLLQILATANEDCANSYLLHMCVFQCGAVTVSQYELFGWENIGSTLQQDTDKPTLQIHAHNTSDKPEEKNILAFTYD